MEIVFPCEHCGRNLVTDEETHGQVVDCPSCGKPVSVPEPIEPKATATTTRKRTIRIPSTPPADRKQSAEVHAPPVSVNRHYPEIVVGWLCVIVGILLEILMPRAVLAYLPFFLGAFVMGFVLLLSGRGLHGIVLLLCTCIPAPLLMRQNIWGELRASISPSSRGSSPRAQKVVFSSEGQAKLVSVDEYARAPVSASPSSPPRQPTRSIEEWKQAQRKPARRVQPDQGAESPSPVTGNSTPAPARPGPADSAQDVDDPYRDLLENKEAIPALVPEDVLASTRPGREEGFLWQDPTSGETLLPGDPAPMVEVPFVLYAEADGKVAYSPSGRLGNEGALTLDPSWDVDPQDGRTCMRIAYADSADWVEAAWQNPPDNWGNLPGGYNLAKASKLTFWAKGDEGGEKVEFRVGMEQPLNATSRDSLRATSGQVRLRNKWKKYSISIEREDRSRIITGFFLRIEGQEKPVVFYLDSIQFE